MQVYLPDDLYRMVKKRRLPASEILQRAVRTELRRLELIAEGDRYLADLIDEEGAPRAAERSAAEAIADRVARHARRRAG
jgi:post-segregation antitoxin (ccd killing protein)